MGRKKRRGRGRPAVGKQPIACRITFDLPDWELIQAAAAHEGISAAELVRQAAMRAARRISRRATPAE